MPVYHYGDLWDYERGADLILITTNSFIKRNRELAMGRGIALQAKERYPELPKLFGRRIKHLSVYGLVIVPHKGKLFGAFQTKIHFKDKSEMSLIELATDKLREFLKDNCLTTLLNFPGVGNGGLAHKEKEIKSILDTLPSCVHVFKVKVGGG